MDYQDDEDNMTHTNEVKGVILSFNQFDNQESETSAVTVP